MAIRNSSYKPFVGGLSRIRYRLQNGEQARCAELQTPLNHSGPDRLMQIGYVVVMVQSALADPKFLPPQ